MNLYEETDRALENIRRKLAQCNKCPNCIQLEADLEEAWAEIEYLQNCLYEENNGIK